MSLFLSTWPSTVYINLIVSLYISLSIFLSFFPFVYRVSISLCKHAHTYYSLYFRKTAEPHTESNAFVFCIRCITFGVVAKFIVCEALTKFFTQRDAYKYSGLPPYPLPLSRNDGLRKQSLISNQSHAVLSAKAYGLLFLLCSLLTIFFTVFLFFLSLVLFPWA